MTLTPYCDQNDWKTPISFSYVIFLVSFEGFEGYSLLNEKRPIKSYQKIYTQNYKGDFKQTPFFIGSSNPDPHIPVQRVHQTTEILKSMNADVTEKIFENMGHTITKNEIDLANELVFK